MVIEHEKNIMGIYITLINDMPVALESLLISSKGIIHIKVRFSAPINTHTASEYGA
jgi:hypothetical protein